MACRRGGRRWPPTWRRRSTRCGTAAPGPGDRIVVVGAGVVGLLVASLAARLPGADVTAVDVDESRRPIVRGAGRPRSRAPSRRRSDADIVFHASASAAGPRHRHQLRRVRGHHRGDELVRRQAGAVELGGAFHSRRLKLVSSQVGQVATSRRPRWDYRRRVEAAVAPAGAARRSMPLVAEEIAFEDAPRELPRILARRRARVSPPSSAIPQA